jgi:type I restriction enzyme S subunit
MFTDLKTSAEMVPIENSVLGQVPTHWQVRPMRSLITSRSARNRADLPLLSVARERGVFVRSTDDDNHNVIPEDLTNYKLARQGDLVINKMKAWQGSLGLAPVDGIVSPAYYVYDFAIENRYFGQALLRSKPYVSLLGAASDGVRIGQWDLSVTRFREIPVLIPPAGEQAAIVKYLGHAHARIDRAIAAKRKLIVLLQEQMQAIIQQAVTRGFDPAVLLKDPGTPWLGDIPTHWRTARLKSLISAGPTNGVSPQITEDGDLQTFSLSAIRSGQVDVQPSDVKYVSRNAVAQIADYQLRSGDVLLIRGNGNLNLVGRAAIVTDDIPDSIYPDLLMRIRVKAGTNPRFLVLSINSSAARDQMKIAARTAVGTFKINGEAVKTLQLALPPLWEQAAIVEKCDNATSRIRSSLDVSLREIELLREFRARLTSDVVTGQVDVRKIADGLADLTDEMLARDEPDEGTALDMDLEQFMGEEEE